MEQWFSMDRITGYLWRSEWGVCVCVCGWVGVCVCVCASDSRRHGEGMLFDSLDHILKENLGGECVTVIDDGLTIRTIPAVH